MLVQLMYLDCSIRCQVLNDVLAFHDRFVCGFDSNDPMRKKYVNRFKNWDFSKFVGNFRLT